jgi:hypothetical protein
MSDAAGPTRGGRPHSRKRVRRTKDRARNDTDGRPSHPLDISYQAAAVASSSGTQESEEMPIHGYFTLKTIASKVVYYLTFLKICCRFLSTGGRDKTVTPTANTLNHFLLILECVRHCCGVRQYTVQGHESLPLTLSQHGGQGRN